MLSFSCPLVSLVGGEVAQAMRGNRKGSLDQVTKPSLRCVREPGGQSHRDRAVVIPGTRRFRGRYFWGFF